MVDSIKFYFSILSNMYFICCQIILWEQQTQIYLVNSIQKFADINKIFCKVNKIVQQEATNQTMQLFISSNCRLNKMTYVFMEWDIAFPEYFSVLNPKSGLSFFPSKSGFWLIAAYNLNIANIIVKLNAMKYKRKYYD